MKVNKNKILIKSASEKDIPLILSFIKELAEYEGLPNEVVATHESLKKALFSSQQYSEVIIGYYDNKPVGFAAFFEKFSAFLGGFSLYLDNLFVKPEYRSKGVGSEMMRYVARLTKKHKYPRIEWWVLNWNKPAINFYNNIESNPMNEWTVYRLSGDALHKLAMLEPHVF